MQSYCKPQLIGFEDQAKRSRQTLPDGVIWDLLGKVERMTSQQRKSMGFTHLEPLLARVNSGKHDNEHKAPEVLGSTANVSQLSKPSDQTATSTTGTLLDQDTVAHQRPKQSKQSRRTSVVDLTRDTESPGFATELAAQASVGSDATHVDRMRALLAGLVAEYDSLDVGWQQAYELHPIVLLPPNTLPPTNSGRAAVANTHDLPSAQALSGHAAPFDQIYGVRTDSEIIFAKKEDRDRFVKDQQRTRTRFAGFGEFDWEENSTARKKFTSTRAKARQASGLIRERSESNEHSLFFRSSSAAPGEEHDASQDVGDHREAKRRRLAQQEEEEGLVRSTRTGVEPVHPMSTLGTSDAAAQDLDVEMHVDGSEQRIVQPDTTGRSKDGRAQE
jgi:hypothetical protein